jgi:hypothetical protein
MSDASGEDLGWFFRGWFYETGTLDQAITTVMQPGGTGGAEGSAESRGARVTIVNKGQLIMPVSFKVEYEDGSTETRRLPVNIWAASDTWQTQWDTGGRRIRRVTLDPDENLPDVDLRNNQWP